MYLCPHCNKPGIHILRKACLGPALSTKCRECGKKVGVPYKQAYLAMAPFAIPILLTSFLDWSSLTISIWVIAFFISEFFYLKFVPLIKK